MKASGSRGKKRENCGMKGRDDKESSEVFDPKDMRVVECCVEGCTNTFKIWGPEPAKPMKCRKRCGESVRPGDFVL